LQESVGTEPHPFEEVLSQMNNCWTASYLAVYFSAQGLLVGLRDFSAALPSKSIEAGSMLIATHL